MKIIDDDDDGQVKKLGKRKDDTPVDPTLQALHGLTKAVESIKSIQPVVSEGDGLKHAEAMGVLHEISKGINQLSKQLTKKAVSPATSRSTLRSSRAWELSVQRESRALGRSGLLRQRWMGWDTITADVERRRSEPASPKKRRFY